MQAYIKSCLKPNVDMVLVLIIIEAMKTNFFLYVSNKAYVTQPDSDSVSDGIYPFVELAKNYCHFCGNNW